MRNMFVGVYIYNILHNFLRGFVKHIKSKNQSARSNFAALKTVLCFNVSSTKMEEKNYAALREFYYLFLKIMPK